ncbi:hypothetical protein CMI37_34165 [Candidatus Pacearchaeota archaeon]|nr:hypothetical protein [Candidatus Pacearchaeota archaeon]
MGWKTTFITQLTDTRTTDVEGVGTIRHEGPNKVYKWVKFNNGAGDVASITGNVAYYYGVSGDAADGDGYEDSVVTMDRTDAFLGAGVFQAVIADGSYGWIQIKGPATLTTALTAGADGDALTHTGAGADGTLDLSADDKDATVAIATDISAKLIICDFPY